MLISTCLDPGTRYAWKEWATSGLKAATGREKTSSGGRRARRRAPNMQMVYLGGGKADLGQYSIEVYDPLTQSILRTDFRLKASTACTSEGEFRRFMDSNRHFFREQVMVTVRTCRFEELVEPDLRLLGKKLVSRVNLAIGWPFLKSANIADYQPMESVDALPFQPVATEDPDDVITKYEIPF